MNWLIFVLVFVAGIATSIQAGVNGNLGKKIGIIEGAFISFVVGTIFLAALMIVLRKGNIMNITDAPKWQLTGGLLGALYIIIMVIAVPKIGVAAAVVCLIFGQITCSVVLDHIGIVPERQIAVNPQRLLGILLMGIALFLFYKK